MDEDEKLDLMEYVSEYLRGFKEIQSIMQTENVELQNLWTNQERLMENGFISTCDEDGLKRYEKMLHVTPLADDTIETRRFRIFTLWNTSIPYNFEYLTRQLAMLCGEDGFQIHFDISKQTIKVEVELVSKNMIDSVRNMLEDILPCNLIRNVEIRYNTYGMLGVLTNAQLAKYTQGQLREEVILQ